MGTPYYILNVQIFYHRFQVVKQACNFFLNVYFLSHVWVQLFFQWSGKTPGSRHNVNIICKGLQIALLLNLRIPILS